MKKLVVVVVLALVSTFAIEAQTFKLGASVGLPMGDAEDGTSVVAGIDAYYYFTDVDAFLQIGATAGFRNYFAKEQEFLGETFKADDVQFIPVAVAGRVKLLDFLSVGADLGYAFAINDGVDGGLYYRPVVGFDIADTIELIASYEGVNNDDFNVGNFNVGVLFTF